MKCDHADKDYHGYLYCPNCGFNKEELKKMNCWNCGAELIWGGDHTFEDYGLDGEGIVANFSCPECESTCEFYTPEKNDNEG